MKAKNTKHLRDPKSPTFAYPMSQARPNRPTEAWSTAVNLATNQTLQSEDVEEKTHCVMDVESDDPTGS